MQALLSIHARQAVRDQSGLTATQVKNENHRINRELNGRRKAKSSLDKKSVKKQRTKNDNPDPSGAPPPAGSSGQPGSSGAPSGTSNFPALSTAALSSEELRQVGVHWRKYAPAALRKDIPARAGSEHKRVDRFKPSGDDRERGVFAPADADLSDIATLSNWSFLPRNFYLLSDDYKELVRSRRPNLFTRAVKLPKDFNDWEVLSQRCYWYTYTKHPLSPSSPYYLAKAKFDTESEAL